MSFDNGDLFNLDAYLTELIRDPCEDEVKQGKALKDMKTPF